MQESMADRISLFWCVRIKLIWRKTEQLAQSKVVLFAQKNAWIILKLVLSQEKMSNKPSYRLLNSCSSRLIKV